MASLINKVSVIIPIYNGYEVLIDLVHSLEEIYPSNISNLSFVFVEDQSTDERIITFLKVHHFFTRSDVTILFNEKNLGFIGGVNRAIKSVPLDSDIILLNTDTKIYSNFADELQRVAYSSGNIGTVTPLTNDGTIASFFNYPLGSTFPKDIDEKKFGFIVSKLDLYPVFLGAPTGIGFALYLKIKMLREIGLLDEIYGKGYGEECDLCQRGINSGYQHLIASNSFIYHKGSESFGRENRINLVKRNAEILEKRFPNYSIDVAEYISSNPLALSRLVILTEYFLTYNDTLGVFHVLHAECNLPNSGGTERHVSWITEENYDHISIIFSPARNVTDTYCIELVYRDFRHKEYLDHEKAKWYLSKYIDALSSIHIHHLLNLSIEIKNIILRSKNNLFFTLHDYYLVCPTINLLSGERRDKFCEAEKEIKKCNECLSNYHGMNQPVIERHREDSTIFLRRADKIFSPSITALNYLNKIFPAFSEKASVLPHNLIHYKAFIASDEPEEMNSSLIVFLGAIGKHKGANLAIEAANKLSSSYKVEFWGEIDESEKKLSPNIDVCSYVNTFDLKVLFDHKKPLFVILPSIWAETFCYTFYEALILSNSIPVVFAYGNPANIITTSGCGIVVKEMSSNSLITTLNAQEKKSNEELRNSIKNYRHKLLSKPSHPIEHSFRLNNSNSPVPLSNADKVFISSISQVKVISNLSFRTHIVNKMIKRFPRLFRFLYSKYKKISHVKKLFSI